MTVFCNIFTLLLLPNLVVSQGCTILEVDFVDENGFEIEPKSSATLGDIYIIGDTNVHFKAQSICGSSVFVGGENYANFVIEDYDTAFLCATNSFDEPDVTGPLYLAFADFCGKNLPPGTYNVSTMQCFPGSVNQDPCIGVASSQVFMIASGFGVKDFVLVGADTDGIVRGRFGYQPSACTGGTTNFNIVAETFGAVGSVTLTLGGPVTAQRTENVVPYALFGDRSGNYFGSTLPSGDYTVTAQAFTGSRGSGEAGSIVSYEFSL